MRIKHISILLIFPLIFLFSCSKTLDLYKAQKRVIDISNNKPIEYVVLKNGDTLKGDLLKFKYRNLSFSEPIIKYNDKKISFIDVLAYQNKDGYCLYYNTTKYPLYRVGHGKINMYYSPSITSQSSFSITTGHQGSSSRGGDLTTIKSLEIYYTNDEINFYTYLNIIKLKDLIKDNVNALAFYENSIKTIRKVKFIDYPKVYKIINIYNGVK